MEVSGLSVKEMNQQGIERHKRHEAEAKERAEARAVKSASQPAGAPAPGAGTLVNTVG